jgi:hypothetical protein
MSCSTAALASAERRLHGEVNGQKTLTTTTRRGLGNLQVAKWEKDGVTAEG